MRASAPSRAVPLGGAVGERGAAQTLAFPLGWGCRAFNQTLGGGAAEFCVCSPRCSGAQSREAVPGERGFRPREVRSF